MEYIQVDEQAPRNGGMAGLADCHDRLGGGRGGRGAGGGGALVGDDSTRRGRVPPDGAAAAGGHGAALTGIKREGVQR